MSPDTGDSNSGGQIVGIATGNNRLPADFAVNSVLFSEAEGHVVATQVESWPTTGIHPAVDPIDQHCETQNGRESKTSALEDGVTAGTANLPFVFSSRLSEDSAARSVVEISTETAEPSVTTLQDDFSGHNSFAYRLVCPYLLPGRELIADGSRVTTDDCDKVADVDVDKKIPEGIVSDTGDTNPPLTPDSTPPSVPTTGPPVESLSPLTVEPFSLVKEDVSQPVVEIKETLLSPPIIREDYSAKQTITELPLLTTTTRNSRHPVDSTVVSVSKWQMNLHNNNNVLRMTHLLSLNVSAMELLCRECRFSTVSLIQCRDLVLDPQV